MVLNNGILEKRNGYWEYFIFELNIYNKRFFVLSIQVVELVVLIYRVVIRFKGNNFEEEILRSCKILIINGQEFCIVLKYNVVKMLKQVDIVNLRNCWENDFMWDIIIGLIVNYDVKGCYFDQDGVE